MPRLWFQCCYASYPIHARLPFAYRCVCGKQGEVHRPGPQGRVSYEGATPRCEGGVAVSEGQYPQQEK